MKEIGLAALAVIVAILLTFFIQEYRWKAKLAASPVTVEVRERIDTIKVSSIHVDTIKVSRVDTVYKQPPEEWFQARGDTVIDGISLQMAYNSPLPLSVRGYFSDIAIQLPPRLDTVRVEYVTKTLTVVEDRIAWEWIVAGASAAFVGGFLLGQ